MPNILEYTFDLKDRGSIDNILTRLNEVKKVVDDTSIDLSNGGVESAERTDLSTQFQQVYEMIDNIKGFFGSSVPDYLISSVSLLSHELDGIESSLKNIYSLNGRIVSQNKKDTMKTVLFSQVAGLTALGGGKNFKTNGVDNQIMNAIQTAESIKAGKLDVGFSAEDFLNAAASFAQLHIKDIIDTERKTGKSAVTYSGILSAVRSNQEFKQVTNAVARELGMPKNGKRNDYLSDEQFENFVKAIVDIYTPAYGELNRKQLIDSLYEDKKLTRGSKTSYITQRLLTGAQKDVFAAYGKNKAEAELIDKNDAAFLRSINESVDTRADPRLALFRDLVRDERYMRQLYPLMRDAGLATVLTRGPKGSRDTEYEFSKLGTVKQWKFLSGMIMNKYLESLSSDMIYERNPNAIQDIEATGNRQGRNPTMWLALSNALKDFTPNAEIMQKTNAPQKGQTYTTGITYEKTPTLERYFIPHVGLDEEGRYQTSIDYNWQKPIKTEGIEERRSDPLVSRTRSAFTDMLQMHGNGTMGWGRGSDMLAIRPDQDHISPMISLRLDQLFAENPDKERRMSEAYVIDYEDKKVQEMMDYLNKKRNYHFDGHDYTYVSQSGIDAQFILSDIVKKYDDYAESLGLPSFFNYGNPVDLLDLDISKSKFSKQVNNIRKGFSSAVPIEELYEQSKGLFSGEKHMSLINMDLLYKILDKQPGQEGKWNKKAGSISDGQIWIDPKYLPDATQARFALGTNKFVAHGYDLRKDLIALWNANEDKDSRMFMGDKEHKEMWVPAQTAIGDKDVEDIEKYYAKQLSSEEEQRVRKQLLTNALEENITAYMPNSANKSFTQFELLTPKQFKTQFGKEAYNEAIAEGRLVNQKLEPGKDFVRLTPEQQVHNMKLFAKAPFAFDPYAGEHGKSITDPLDRSGLYVLKNEEDMFSGKAFMPESALRAMQASPDIFEKSERLYREEEDALETQSGRIAKFLNDAAAMEQILADPNWVFDSPEANRRIDTIKSQLAYNYATNQVMLEQERQSALAVENPGDLLIPFIEFGKIRKNKLSAEMQAMMPVNMDRSDTRDDGRAATTGQRIWVPGFKEKRISSVMRFPTANSQYALDVYNGAADPVVKEYFSLQQKNIEAGKKIGSYKKALKKETDPEKITELNDKINAQKKVIQKNNNRRNEIKTNADEDVSWALNFGSGLQTRIGGRDIFAGSAAIATSKTLYSMNTGDFDGDTINAFYNMSEEMIENAAKAREEVLKKQNELEEAEIRAAKGDKPTIDIPKERLKLEAARGHYNSIAAMGTASAALRKASTASATDLDKAEGVVQAMRAYDYATSEVQNENQDFVLGDIAKKYLSSQGAHYERFMKWIHESEENPDEYGKKSLFKYSLATTTDPEGIYALAAGAHDKINRGFVDVRSMKQYEKWYDKAYGTEQTRESDAARWYLSLMEDTTIMGRLLTSADQDRGRELAKKWRTNLSRRTNAGIVTEDDEEWERLKQFENRVEEINNANAATVENVQLMEKQALAKYADTGNQVYADHAKYLKDILEVNENMTSDKISPEQRMQNLIARKTVDIQRYNAQKDLEAAIRMHDESFSDEAQKEDRQKKLASDYSFRVRQLAENKITGQTLYNWSTLKHFIRRDEDDQNIMYPDMETLDLSAGNAGVFTKDMINNFSRYSEGKNTESDKQVLFDILRTAAGERDKTAAARNPWTHVGQLMHHALEEYQKGIVGAPGYKKLSAEGVADRLAEMFTTSDDELGSRKYLQNKLGITFKKDDTTGKIKAYASKSLPDGISVEDLEKHVNNLIGYYENSPNGKVRKKGTVESFVEKLESTGEKLFAIEGVKYHGQNPSSPLKNFGSEVFQNVVYKEDGQGNIIAVDKNRSRVTLKPSDFDVQLSSKEVAEGWKIGSYKTHMKPDYMTIDKDGKIRIYDYKSGKRGSIDSLGQSAFYASMYEDLGREYYRSKEELEKAKKSGNVKNIQQWSERVKQYEPYADFIDEKTGKSTFAEALGFDPKVTAAANGMMVRQNIPNLLRGQTSTYAEDILKAYVQLYNLAKTGMQNEASELAGLAVDANTNFKADKEFEEQVAKLQQPESKTTLDFLLASYAQDKESLKKLSSSTWSEYFKLHPEAGTTRSSRFSKTNAELKKLFNDDVIAAAFAEANGNKAMEAAINEQMEEKRSAIIRNNTNAMEAATQDVLDVQESARRSFRNVQPGKYANKVLNAYKELNEAELTKEYLTEDDRYYANNHFLTKPNDNSSAEKRRVAEAKRREFIYNNAKEKAEETRAFVDKESEKYINKYVDTENKKINNLISGEIKDPTKIFQEYIQKKRDQIQEMIDQYNENVKDLEKEIRNATVKGDTKTALNLSKMALSDTASKNILEDYLSNGMFDQQETKQRAAKLGLVVEPEPSNRKQREDFINERISQNSADLAAAQKSYDDLVANEDKRKNELYDKHISELEKEKESANTTYDQSKTTLALKAADWRVKKDKVASLVRDKSSMIKDGMTEEEYNKQLQEAKDAAERAKKDALEYNRSVVQSSKKNVVEKSEELANQKTNAAKAAFIAGQGAEKYDAEKESAEEKIQNLKEQSETLTGYANINAESNKLADDYQKYVKDIQAYQDQQKIDAIKNNRLNNMRAHSPLRLMGQGINRRKALENLQSAYLKQADFAERKRALSLRDLQLYEKNAGIKLTGVSKEEREKEREKLALNDDKYREKYKSYMEAKHDADLNKEMANETEKSAKAIHPVAEQIGGTLNYLFRRFGYRMFTRVLSETKKFVQDFDKAMTSIQMITLKTDEQMSTIGDGLIAKAKELKISISEITQSAETLYRQGLSDEEVNERLDVISKFSKVSGTKVDAATKLITVAMNTGLVTDAQTAADIVTALGDQAATNAAEIEKGIEKAGAAAAADGTTFAQLASMLTAITSTTQIGGNVSGRTLNTIFGRMNKIGTNELIVDENGNKISGSAVAKLLKAQGIDTYDSKGNKRSSYDVLYDLSQKWDQLSDAEQQQLASAIAGTRQYSNFAAIMQGMSEGKVDEYMSLAGSAEGVVDEKYEIYAKSLQASLTDLKNTWDELIHDLTDTGALTGVIGFFTSMIQGVDNLTNSIGGFGAALETVIPMLIGLGALKAGLSTGNLTTIGVGLAALTAGGIIASVNSGGEDVNKKLKEANKEYDESYKSRQKDVDRYTELKQNANRTESENREYFNLSKTLAVQFGLIDSATASTISSMEALTVAIDNVGKTSTDTKDAISEAAEERNKSAWTQHLNENFSGIAVELEKDLKDIDKSRNKDLTPMNPILTSQDLWHVDETGKLILNKGAGQRQNDIIMSAMLNSRLLGFTGFMSSIFGGKTYDWNKDLKPVLPDLYSNAAAKGYIKNKDGSDLTESQKTKKYWQDKLEHGNVHEYEMQGMLDYYNELYKQTGYSERNETISQVKEKIKNRLTEDVLLNQYMNDSEIDYLADLGAQYHMSSENPNRSTVATLSYLLGENPADNVAYARELLAQNNYQPTGEITKNEYGLEPLGKYDYYVDEDGKIYTEEEANEYYEGLKKTDRKRAIEVMQAYNQNVIDELGINKAQIESEYQQDLLDEAKHLYYTQNDPNSLAMLKAAEAYYRDKWIEMHGGNQRNWEEMTSQARQRELAYMKAGGYGIKPFDLISSYEQKRYISENADWDKLTEEERNQWINQARNNVSRREVDESKLIGGIDATAESLGKFYDENSEELQKCKDALDEAAQQTANDAKTLKKKTHAFVKSLDVYSSGDKGWLNKNQAAASSDNITTLLMSGRFGAGAEGLLNFMNYVESNPNIEADWTNAINANLDLQRVMHQASYDKNTNTWTAPEDIMTQMLYATQSGSLTYGAAALTTQQKAQLAQEAFSGLTEQNWFVSQEAKDAAQENAWVQYQERFKNAIASVDANKNMTQQQKEMAKGAIRSGYGVYSTKENFLSHHAELNVNAMNPYQQQYLKEALGEQMYARVLEANAGGRALTDEENTLIQRLISNRSVGLTSLTSRQQLDWLNANQSNLETLGKENGISRSVADTYMAQWKDWNEYAALVEARNTGNMDLFDSLGGVDKLKEYRQSLENFKKQTQIKLDIEGVQTLEEANELLEGTAELIEKIKKGGKFEIEALFKIRSETFELGQLGAKLKNGSEREKIEAITSLTGASKEEYLASPDVLEKQANEEYARRQESRAKSLAYQREVASNKDDFDRIQAAGYTWHEGTYKLPRGLDFDGEGNVISIKTGNISERQTKRYQQSRGYYTVDEEGNPIHENTLANEYYFTDSDIADYRKEIANGSITFDQIKNDEQAVAKWNAAVSSMTTEERLFAQGDKSYQTQAINAANEAAREQEISDNEKELKNKAYNSSTDALAYGQYKYEESNKAKLAAQDVYDARAGKTFNQMLEEANAANTEGWKELLQSNEYQQFADTYLENGQLKKDIDETEAMKAFANLTMYNAGAGRTTKAQIANMAKNALTAGYSDKTRYAESYVSSVFGSDILAQWKEGTSIEFTPEMQKMVDDFTGSKLTSKEQLTNLENLDLKTGKDLTDYLAKDENRNYIMGALSGFGNTEEYLSLLEAKGTDQFEAKGGQKRLDVLEKQLENFKKNAKIQFELEGIDAMEQAGEVIEGTTESLKKLGGTAIEASTEMNRISNQAYESGQLSAKLYKGTTEQRYQAAMQITGMSATEFYKNIPENLAYAESLDKITQEATAQTWNERLKTQETYEGKQNIYNLAKKAGWNWDTESQSFVFNPDLVSVDVESQLLNQSIQERQSSRINDLLSILDGDMTLTNKNEKQYNAAIGVAGTRTTEYLTKLTQSNAGLYTFKEGEEEKLRQAAIRETQLSQEQIKEQEALEDARLGINSVGSAFGYAQLKYQQNNKAGLAANAIYQRLTSEDIKTTEDLANAVNSKDVKNWEDLLESSEDVRKAFDEVGAKIADDGTIDFSGVKSAGYDAASALQILTQAVAGASEAYNKQQEVLSTGETRDRALDYLEGIGNEEKGFEAYSEYVGNSKLAQIVRNRRLEYDEDLKAYNEYKALPEEVKRMMRERGEVIPEDPGEFIPYDENELSPLEYSYAKQLENNALYGINGLTDIQRFDMLQQMIAEANAGNLTGIYNEDRIGMFADATSSMTDASKWMQTQMKLEQSNLTMSDLLDADKVAANYDTINEAVKDTYGSVTAAVEAQKKWDAELQGQSIRLAQQFGEYSNDAADALENFAKGGKDAARQSAQWTKSISMIKDQLFTVKQARGKTPNNVGSKEAERIASWLNLPNKEDVKKLTQKQFDDALDAMEDEAQKTFNQNYFQPMLQGAFEDINKAIGENKITFDQVVDVITQVNDSGDMSAFIELLEQIKSKYASVAESMSGDLLTYIISVVKIMQGTKGIVDVNASVQKSSGTTSAGSKYLNKQGGGGGGKSSLDKLLEKQKHEIAISQHNQKMAQIEETTYDRLNDHANYLASIDKEIAALKEMQTLRKTHLEQLDAERQKYKEGSDERMKADEQYMALQEDIANHDNEINELEVKRNIEHKQKENDNEMKPGTHMQNMLDKYAQRALNEDRFGDYETNTLLRMEEIGKQKDLNNEHIEEWKTALYDFEENSDAWIEIRDKIWALEEENAELDNQLVEQQLQLNEQRLSQIAKVLQFNSQTATHNLNIASTYANAYQSGGYRSQYEGMIEEQIEANKKLITVNTQAMKSAQAQLDTLEEGTTSWFNAQAAVYQYQEAIASTKATQMELNRALAESDLEGVMESFNDATREYKNINGMLESRASYYKDMDDYEAYAAATEMIIENDAAERDAIQLALQRTQDKYNKWMKTGTFDPSIQRQYLDQINDLESQLNEKALEINRKVDEQQKERLNKIFENMEYAHSEYDHNQNLLGYQTSTYQTRGELTNYGHALEEDTSRRKQHVNELNDELKILYEEQARLYAQNKQGTEEEKRVVEWIKKNEEARAKENETIEKNNKLLEENQRKIVQVRKTLEDSVDKEIKEQERRAREILAGNVSMQNSITDVMKKAEQERWNLQKKTLDKEKENLNEYKKLINERFNYRKNAESKADKEQEIAEYRRQLALVEADPTRTKDAKELRKKIADMEKEMSWNIAEEELNAENERIDEQGQAIDKYIKYYEEQLSDLLSDTNNFFDEMNEILSGSYEEAYAKVIEFMKQENEEFKKSLPDAQQQMIQSWEDTTKKAFGIIDNNAPLIQDILSSKESYLSYQRTNAEYQAQLANGDLTAVQQSEMAWSKLYDDYLASIKDDAEFDLHEHDLGDVYTRIDELKDDTFKVNIVDITGTAEKAFGFSDDTTTYTDLSNHETPEITDLTGIAQPVTEMQKDVSDIADAVADSGSGGGSGSKSNGKKIYYFTTTDNNGNPTSQGGSVEASSLEEARKLAEKEAKEMGKLLDVVTEKTYDVTKNKINNEQKINSNVTWDSFFGTTLADKVADAISSVASIFTNEQNRQHFASGGLVDYTGPAWVDGTPSKPEAFLSATDTANMRAMLDSFNFIKTRPYMSHIDSSTMGNTTNVGDINITINQAELKTDEDIDRLANRVGAAFTKQLSRQGFNLSNYAFG